MILTDVIYRAFESDWEARPFQQRDVMQACQFRSAIDAPARLRAPGPEQSLRFIETQGPFRQPGAAHGLADIRKLFLAHGEKG